MSCRADEVEGLVEGCVLGRLGFMRTPVRSGHDRGLTPDMALRGVGIGLDHALGILVGGITLRVLLLAPLGESASSSSPVGSG
jgi:hypothetical protein